MNYAGKFGSSGLDPLSSVDMDFGQVPQLGELSHGKFHVVDKVSTHAPSDAIVIPDAHLLFTGDFKRSGVDLILTSGDREVVLHDYFKGEKRAPLASPDGAHLTGDIVNALAGHTQFAQAGGSASVAPPVIGHVTKLTGSATAIRNGVSIILNQGDNVNKGDVVQSGSDSTLGITFIDGTVFGLASNAKMVLNEMVYDPNGSDNKSLLSLVQGTISFVAGATAKHGDMKVDTPVATMGIRGTAVLVEIDFEVPGQGSAPSSKFQVLVEPDGTTGSYILFDKTTLTPIATVNQAGTQTIINGQGTVTFLSSAQLSPDAQRIITDVFSLKFSDLNNPNTKLTNNFTDSIVPENQFVKFADLGGIQVKLQFANIPDRAGFSAAPNPGNKLEHIPGPPEAHATSGSSTERVDITASSIVDSVSGKVSYADTNVGDIPSVSTKFSSFTYQNAQHADVTESLTAEQLAAIQAVAVPLSVEQDPNLRNTGQATWTYNVADGAFDFLGDGETLTLTYIARVDNNFAPFNETAFKSFTIVITGTNDKPTISAGGGAITERIGTGNTAIDTVTGTVVFTDVDLTDRPVVSAAISTTDPFRYYDSEGNDVTASLTAQQRAAILAVEVPLTVVQAAGNTHNGSAKWTYSVVDSKFDFIAKGETLTLNYVAKVDDGHGGIVSTPITVSIHGADVVVVGTNDVPTIDTTSAAFAELSNDKQPNPTGSTDLDTVSGTITFTDVDLTDRPVASAVFTTFTYQSAAHGDVTSQLTATQLAAIAAVEMPLTVTQAAGNTNNGSASWSYSAADGAFDFLADGEILTLTYTATVNDGHGGVVSKPVTVTVTGSNDTAVITSDPQTGTITEIADTQDSTTPDTAHGAIQFVDVDLTDTHEVTITDVAASGVMTGLADHDTRFGWLKLGALADSTNGVTGSQNWTFSAPDDYFDYLADGEAVTLTYTVEVDDHHGSIVTQTVAVTVNGSNDAPEVAADVSGAGGLHAITEQESVTGSAGLDNASGSVAFRDVDLSDTHTFGSSKPAFAWLDSNGDPLTLNATLEGVLRAASAFTLTPHDSTGTGLGSVDFSYSAADKAFDFLAAGEKLTITYDITVTDEHGAASTRPVTITVTGTNDAPVAVADTDTGHIVEAGHDADDNVVFGVSTTSGHVLGNDIDVDISDTHEVVGVVAGTVSGVLSTGVGKTIVGTYGSLLLDASGSWTYTLDNTNPLTNALAQDAHVIDVFSYTESDHHGGTSTTTLTIDITGTNDAPVAAADLNTGPAVVERGVNPGNTAFEGADTAAGNVLSNDHDVDVGDTKAVQGVASGTATGPLNGQVATSVSGTYGHVSIATEGTWTYALNNGSAATQALTQGQHVTDVFTYTMRDALGSTSSATLTIDITGTNDAPTLADVITAPLVDTAANDSFGTVTGTLAGSDRDSGEAATLRYAALDDGHAVNAAVIGHYGSLTVDEHGNYSYVPDAALINALHEGDYSDTFTVRTTDAHGATATAKFTVKVTGANDTPSIVGEVDPAAQIVVVAPASPHVLAAGVSVNSLGLNTETFDSQTAGPVSSNGFGRGTFDSAALGAHFSASGNAGVVIGSSSVTAAPFVGPSPGHQDTTKYLSIGGNATETITFTSQKNVFGLYWGSVDSYNTIKFYDGTTLVASYTGADISPLLSNGNQGSFASNGYVEFSGLHSFNKVVLGSTSNAFEIDNISAGYIPPPTVKPVTGTLSVHDADIGDTLTAFVTGNATIDYNGSTTVPGGIDISALIAAGDVTFDSMLSNGGTAVLQWTYHPANANLDFLHAGDVLKIKFVAEVSDGHGHTGSQPLTVTLVGSANASTAGAAGPVIATDAFTVTDLGNGVTRISGLHVTDADATASTDSFTVSAATGNAGTSVAPLAGSVSGVAGINAALNGGITYDPHGSQQADSVTLTVADSFGHTDRVHFIFNQGGAGTNVALTGTSGKDVIFATGHADTLTGGASADQFVFAPETSPSADTITDFNAGEDHIDLRSFSFVDSSNIATWLGTHAAASPANAADTLIALDTGDTITLKGVAHTSLHASDFIVSPHH